MHTSPDVHFNHLQDTIQKNLIHENLLKISVAVCIFLYCQGTFYSSPIEN